jgi:hypothetical protein
MGSPRSPEDLPIELEAIQTSDGTVALGLVDVRDADAT